jgi:hypothetical protein
MILRVTCRRAALCIVGVLVAACSAPAVSTPNPAASVGPLSATVDASTPSPIAVASAPGVVVGGDRPVTVRVRIARQTPVALYLL